MGAPGTGSRRPAGISLGRAATARLRLRRVLLGTGAIGLAAGVWAGLVGLGWTLPGGSLHLAAGHGPLLVVGFFATLIGLERAVALGRGWAFAGPSAAVLSIVALLAGLPSLVVRASATLAVAGVALAFAYLAWWGRALHLSVMLAGTLAWVWGNLGWLAGWPLGEVVPAWLAGFVLVIAGERLELSRVVARGNWMRGSFLAALAAVLLGASLWPAWPELCARLFGLGLLGLAAWLLRNDIARRGLRHPGLHRYSAVCLLAGYAWLGFGGLLYLAWGPQAGGYRYDAQIHAVTLGFIFSMVFAHAPIIFPVITGLRYRYLPVSYAPLLLLTVSLLVRLAGDVAATAELRRWGGLGNSLALLLFLLATAASVRAAATGPRGR